MSFTGWHRRSGDSVCGWKQVWPLSWLGLSYETLSDAIPFLTPQVRAGLSLAIMGIPSLPIENVTLESPIPSPAQDVICLGINYMAHSDEAEKYSSDAFATKHQDAIYFSKRVTRAVPDGGFIEAHADLVKKLDYECELAVVLGKDAKDVPAGQTQDYVFGYTILNDVSAAMYRPPTSSGISERVSMDLRPSVRASSQWTNSPTIRPSSGSGAGSMVKSGRIPIPPCRSSTSIM